MSSELPSAVDDSPVEFQEIPPAKLRPWGPWATIGWTILLIVAMIALQSVVVIGFVVARMARKLPVDAAELAENGLILGVATVLTTTVEIGLVALLIRWRNQPIRDYLALRWPSLKALLGCMVGLAVVVVGTDGVSFLVCKPIVPEVMIRVYQSGPPALVWLALVVGAPLGEETIFRGFFYRGLVDRWGVFAAILIPSLVFAALHTQYDLFAVGGVFVLGVYLAMVRHYTKSLNTTILLHAMANTYATIEILVMIASRP